MIDLIDMRVDFDKSLDEPCSILCDSTISAEVEVISHFPGPVNCSEVTVTVKAVKNAASEGSKLSRINGKKSDQPIEPVESEKQHSSSRKTISSSNEYIPIKEQLHLKQDGSLSSVALVCPSAQQLLG
jgi:hypothetical protein